MSGIDTSNLKLILFAGLLQQKLPNKGFQFLTSYSFRLFATKHLYKFILYINLNLTLLQG